MSARVDNDFLTVHRFEVMQKMPRILRKICARVARIVAFDFALRQIVGRFGQIDVDVGVCVGGLVVRAFATQTQRMLS